LLLVSRWALSAVILAFVAGCGRIAFSGISDPAADGPPDSSPYDNSLAVWLDMEESNPAAGITERARGATVQCIANQCPFSSIGHHGRGFQFDGIDDALEVFATLPVVDYTYEVWAVSNSAAFQGLLTSHGTADLVGGFELDIENQVDVWSNGVEHIVTPANVAAMHHYTVTRDSGALTVYIDGSPADDAVDTITHDFAGCPLLVGQDTDDGCTDSLNAPFFGVMDEVRIYTRALSSAEIATDMNSATPLLR
jgi:Concanavalin A-like lectin/glucanases superfamily